MQAYPVHLPVFLAAGYGITPEDVLLTGEGIDVRERTASPVDTISVSTILTSNQLAVFEGWFYHLIKRGASWFTVSLQYGNSHADQTARFIDGYSVTLITRDDWEVTARLEVRP